MRQGNRDPKEGARPGLGDWGKQGLQRNPGGHGVEPQSRHQGDREPGAGGPAGLWELGGKEARSPRACSMANLHSAHLQNNKNQHAEMEARFVWFLLS